MIWAVLGLLLIVLTFLRILVILGRSNTAVTYRAVDTGPPPLPARSPAAIRASLDAMPREWVTYMGSTPPLNLLVRGLTHENLRRVSRMIIDELGGQTAMDRLPLEQATQLMLGMQGKMIAEAYVLDWDGAQYPNGAPLPFSTSSMAVLLDEDAHLLTFVTDHAHRLSPDWKDGVPPPIE